jgi:flagella basal body P-ring formation protein FlgA
MNLLRTLALVSAAALALPLRADPVTAASTAFTPENLQAALSRDLASHFSLEGDFQVTLTRPFTPGRPVGDGWTLTVDDYPLSAESTMLVHGEIRDADGPQDATFLLHATLWRDAWAVRLPLTVGSAFDASRLETRRCDMLREHELLPAAVGDSSYIFARSVPVGRMLTWHDLSRHQQVRKGQLVEVTAADGLLVVSMKVLALEGGVKGDTITVRNPDSNKDFSALVTDENHVQVQF